MEPSLRPLIAFTILLASCASPEVQYGQVTGEDNEGHIKFRLAHSVITFTPIRNKEGEIQPDVGIASVPVAKHGPDEPIYTIEGTDWYENWGVDTRLSSIYREDTDLIQSVGVAVEDRRTQIIQTAGAAITTAISLLTLQEKSAALDHFPKGLDITNLLNEAVPGGSLRSIENEKSGCKSETVGDRAGRDGKITCTDLKLEGKATWIANLTIHSVPKDAFEASNFREGTSKALIYSACRDMNLTVSRAFDDDTTIEKTVNLRVADPKFVQALKFPDKGKVSMSATCGASSTTEAVTTSTGLDLVNALLSQAAGVRDALEKKSGAKK